MSILDMRAETVADRLWLVTNEDGSHEIVSETEKNGRGGFAPAWGRPYRDILAEFVRSIDGSVAKWLAFYQACQRGPHVAPGPLGSREMPALFFVANGTAYKAYLGAHHKGSLLGFGGALAAVKPASGEPFESNNVWHIDKVPPYLRDLLPDTATMEWQR